MDVAVMAETAPALALVSTGDARPIDASTEPTESTEVFAALLAALMTQPAAPAPAPVPAAPAGAGGEPVVAAALPIALTMPVPIAPEAVPQLAAPTATAADETAAVPAPLDLPVSTDLPPVDGAVPAALEAIAPAATGAVDLVAPAVATADTAAAPPATGAATTDGGTDTPADQHPASAPLAQPAERRQATTEAIEATAAGAPLRAPAARAVEAPVAAAPRPSAPPPDPATQIVRAIAPLRKLGDGTHRVVLELRPVDLGVVRVELSVASGVVHLGMRAEADATGELLRAAMPGLRAQLDAAGLSTGRLSVDGGAGGRGQHDTAWTAASSDREGRRRAPADDGQQAERRSSPSTSASHGLVDVLL